MSWIPVPDDSHFSLENLPFGIISTAEDPTPRAAIAIGESVLDLKAFASGNGFSAAPEIHSRSDLFSAQTLNPFAAAGRPFHRQVRAYLRSILAADTPHPQSLRDNQTLKDVALLDIAKVQSHMPMQIGDYTDFYAGKNHAYNVGVLFRGPENALQSNYTHLPVGYHGRASSVVVSGTPIRRPWGQTLKDPKADPKIPAFGPCERLDIELEMGMFFCRGNELGEPIPVNEADDYIFGYVLMNDWSARDVQAWEYVPLGPFTSKNLGTSISPWVVLADALEQHKVPALPNDSKPQPYLAEEVKENVLDIDLEVELLSPNGSRTIITNTSSRNLLWSWPQMIAHHTITGCNMRTGDLFGSGTISGTEPGSFGSMLEQTQGGKTVIQLSDGTERMFLQDGDIVVIRGSARGQGGGRIGFGEVHGTIEPALPLF